MPILDTEALFGLNPMDKRHKNTMNVLKEMREEKKSIFAPDTSLLEFQIVLRSLDRRPLLIRDSIMALRKAFKIGGIEEAKTVDANLLAAQCEIEETCGLTYFDSLVAASTLLLDRELVSDDAAFDRVPSIKRISITKK